MICAHIYKRECRREDGTCGFKLKTKMAHCLSLSNSDNGACIGSEDLV